MSPNYSPLCCFFLTNLNSSEVGILIKKRIHQSLLFLKLWIFYLEYYRVYSHSPACQEGGICYFLLDFAILYHSVFTQSLHCNGKQIFAVYFSTRHLLFCHCEKWFGAFQTKIDVNWDHLRLLGSLGG